VFDSSSHRRELPERGIEHTRYDTRGSVRASNSKNRRSYESVSVAAIATLKEYQITVPRFEKRIGR
jgi:hypothetical protein